MSIRPDPDPDREADRDAEREGEGVRAAIATWRHACGLARPRPGAWAWMADPHVVAALLAAPPVLAALALAAGAQMRVVTGWGAALSFVAWQPLAEEVVFRGLLQGALLERWPGRRAGPLTLANLGTTAAFVALHLPAQPPAWALAVAVPSLVFGHLRERFDSVLPAVAMHAAYNAGFALTALWVHR